MKLFFVLPVLLSLLGKVFSEAAAPVVSTLFSGPVVPGSIWSDANGNIYGCENGFHAVFKITSGGVKTDFAGTRGTSGVALEGVVATNALFNSPRAVWGDEQFLYVTDSVNNRIRRVSWSTSFVTTIVGGGSGSILTNGEFLGTSVALTLPNAIAGSSNGKVYFADFGHVYVLTPETGLVGMVSFIAGGGDRIGTFAHGAQVSLKDIQGLAVDPTNNNFLFVADSGNKVVRKMDVATGHSVIFAGRVKKENFVLPSKPFENDETAYKVKFGNPSSVWVGGDGSVFIADSLFHTISVVRHDKIYLFAGKWQSGAISNTLMTGPASEVQIEASHIFGDSSKGVLYVADGTRGGIQKISSLAVNLYTPTATPTVRPTKNPTEVPTVPPTNNPTHQPSSQPTTQPSRQPTSKPTKTPPLISKTNLDAKLAIAGSPTGVWVDANGNIFVASKGSDQRIYIQSTSGAVTAFAGTGTNGNSIDGGQATLSDISDPLGLWGDSENLYYCDSGTNRVRVINFVSKKITTIAGGGTDGGVTTEPQTATRVSISGPRSVWGDGEDSLYILTDRSLLRYSFDDETLQIIAYSDFGAQKTGEDGCKVPLLDLASTHTMGHMTGDATRKCLYITEISDNAGNQLAIVRKLDLRDNSATIFAGTYRQSSYATYTDGVLATNIKFAGHGEGPAGLWVGNDGTVFVSDYGTGSISAINPNTNEITWFAGKWNDRGSFGFQADPDSDNVLNIGGSPKLAKMYPTYLAGNSQLNTLYMVDFGHFAVRKISPLFTSPAPLVRRKLEVVGNLRLRGSSV
jgi:sugar lactone lactonase YvrE